MCQKSCNKNYWNLRTNGSLGGTLFCNTVSVHEFCISQGTEVTFFKYDGQVYNQLREISFTTNYSNKLIFD